MKRLLICLILIAPFMGCQMLQKAATDAVDNAKKELRQTASDAVTGSGTSVQLLNGVVATVDPESDLGKYAAAEGPKIVKGHEANKKINTFVHSATELPNDGQGWAVLALKTSATIAGYLGPYGAIASPILLTAAGWLESKRRKANARTHELAGAIEGAKVDGVVDFNKPETKVALHKAMGDTTKNIVKRVRSKVNGVV